MRISFPLFILIAWIVMAISGTVFTLHGEQVQLERILQGPALQEWMGYDDLGRPVWDRLVMGAATSCIVAISVVLISATLGSFIGALSAYRGGFTDALLVRVIDIFLAFPGILLAIALAGIMGPGIDNVILALAVVGWVGYARLARAQTLALKHREHVVAAQALGTGQFRIVIRHLLPLISAPLIVEATFGIASVVIAEAGLSFLGLGVQPPEASWGSMIRDGARYMLVAPHMVLIPGFSLMLVVLAVNLLGDRLRDWLDVKQRDNRR